MRKKLLFILLFVILMPIYLSSTGCNFSESQNKIIDFKCKNLESAIRDKIDNPSNNICVSDVEHITELSLIGYEISDISPLSNLSNLTELNLNWNEISDISPLSNLTNLKILYLENNELEDILAISQF